MRQGLLAAAAAVLVVVPLAACSNDPDAGATESDVTESAWEDRYRQTMSDQFANTDAEGLRQTCETLATAEVDDTGEYIDYVMARDPGMTVEEWLMLLDVPALSDIVPDDVELETLLGLTGEAHLDACDTLG